MEEQATGAFHHPAAAMLKLLFISMAAVAFGGAKEEIRFHDDYPCQGIRCMWVSPPPLFNPCGPAGDCSSSPTPYRRSKNAGRGGAAPGPREGHPSTPPSVWETPPPPPLLPTPAPQPAVPGDDIAAPT